MAQENAAQRLTDQPDPTVFPIASCVLAQYATGPPTRLHTRWQGPMKVIYHRDSEYVLLNIVSKKTKKIHATKLKIFLFDSGKIEPMDSARRDYMEFYIEAITAHKGNTKKVSTLTFLVKWLNYSEEYNSWEPWSALRLTDQLQTYLKNVGLKALVPCNLCGEDMPV